jgi:hypothetical protein
LVVGIVSCSLMSIEKPLYIVTYESFQHNAGQVVRTYSMVSKRGKTLIDPSFRMPVSDCHVCDEEEKDAKED